MPGRSLFRFVVAAILAVWLHEGSFAAAAEMPPVPKVSTFAPAKDLVNQTDKYLRSLANCVADEAEYRDSQGKIAKESNTLIILALALGLHDEANKFQSQAGAMMQAAKALAATNDFAAAQKAVAALQEAAQGKTKADVELSWAPSASLAELMKQVPLVNTKLKRNIKPAKFKKKAKDTAGYTAVIAAIAQGSMADTSAAKKPEDAAKWYAFMAAMRDDAAAVNRAIRQGDEPAAAKAMKKLQQGCEECHAVFHPEALETTSEEEE